MNKYKFYWIDAFTNERLGGNPCAVVLDAEGLSNEEMQKIAKEMNLSETAFTIQSSKADFGARYFTPTQEIPLAGHPTISTVKSLIQAEQIDPTETSAISLELKAGVISVEITVRDSILITMSQRKPEFLATHDKELIANLFSLKPKDIVDSSPVQTVSTGTPQLMVPLKTHEALKSATMNVEKYKEYKKKSDFFSPHLFCAQGFTNCHRKTRAFRTFTIRRWKAHPNK